MHFRRCDVAVFYSEEAITLEGHEGGVRCLLQLKYSSKLLISGSHDGNIKIWDLSDGLPKSALL